jgi:hypothetical protein
MVVLSFIWEMIGLNLHRGLKVVCNFPKLLKANVKVVPEVG